MNWAKSIGGLPELVRRSNENLAALESWVEQSDWITFLAQDKAIRSNTSVCFKIIDSWYTNLSPEDQAAHAKSLVNLLETEHAAYDIGAYRDAPPGLRIWAGATVESSDITLLTEWLDWGFNTLKEQAAKAA